MYLTSKTMVCCRCCADVSLSLSLWDLVKPTEAKLSSHPSLNSPKCKCSTVLRFTTLPTREKEGGNRILRKRTDELPSGGKCSVSIYVLLAILMQACSAHGNDLVSPPGIQPSGLDKEHGNAFQTLEIFKPHPISSTLNPLLLKKNTRLFWKGSEILHNL